jgi:hypothetical protein
METEMLVDWRKDSIEEVRMKKAFFLFLFMMMLSAAVVAQVKSGDIYGKVLMADGTAIPGVRVTLTGTSIAPSETVTSENGNFRFLQLPPGDYDLKFELEGFKTLLRKNIRIDIGKTVTVNIPMEVGQLQEQVLVTARAGSIDTRKTTLQATFTKDDIAALPTARNPWTVLSALPGVQVDRVDVGGADSGQQSNFLVGGGVMDDTVWNVDGANITDPSAIGAAPAYLNVNTFEEIQMTMGANDITAQTGGVQLNFVTKRAGNRVSGDFHMYVEDKAWEMKQTPTAYMTANDLVIPGVNRLYQYGIDVGGPIVKDKVWWYGSWAIQDIHKRAETNVEDATWLASGYAKLNFQLGNTTGDFHMSNDAKKKWGRPAVAISQQNNGSLWDQDGPSSFYYGGLSQTFGKLMLEAKVIYSDGGFVLDPRGANINPATGHNEGADTRWVENANFLYDSYEHYITNRNTIALSLHGNYFQEKTLGGDHEIRFGVDYYNGNTTTQSLYANQRQLYIYPDGHNWIDIHPDYVVNVNFKRYSAFLQDTINFGRLTAIVGLRYDKEMGAVNPLTQPAFTWYEPGSPYDGQPMFTDFIKPLEVKSRVKASAAWSMLSPRLSMTYDFGGDGKNVLKLAAGRYMSQSGNNLAGNYVPRRYGSADWYDANGDQIPQFSEVGALYDYSRFVSVDPQTGLNRVRYADDYNSPILDELTLSFDKGVGEDLVFNLTGFYKRTHNLTQDIESRSRKLLVYKGYFENGALETQANYELKYTTVGGVVTPYYEQIEAPYGNYYYNLKNSDYRYLGAQFMFSKRLSKHWMMNASFTYQDWKRHWAKEDLVDLTNYDFFNGGVVAPASEGSGISDLFINSRWLAKLTGLYQAPWGINLSGFIQVREGQPQPAARQLSLSQGTTYVYRLGQKFGDERLPVLWIANLGLEKTLKIAENSAVTFSVDWYNVTNNQIVIKDKIKIGDTYPTGGLEPTMWTNAGLFQFGVRVKF